MSSSVHVKDSTLITPSEPTPNHILQLSALDSQRFIRFSFEFLLIYKPHHGVLLDRAATTEKFKTALAQALIPYYPLAGRVRNRANGLGLEVVCRAQGMLFTEAVSDCTISEFKGAPKHTTQWRSFLLLNEADVLKGGPPLVVQLTWLSDGVATLAAGFNHCLCDAPGAIQFLNSLAKLATDRCGLDEFKPKPTWNRHLFDLAPCEADHHNLMSHHPEFGSVPDLCGFTSRFIQENLTRTSTTFSGRQVNELKKVTKSMFTSFEVLAAHLWRSWAKALDFPPNQVTKLVFSMNIRGRVEPSVPIGYYGNAFVYGCAETCVGDLNEKGLGYAAELVKKAKERVDDEYVRRVVEALSSGANLDSVGVLKITQWSRLGLTSLDFGIGRLTQVETICNDYACILLPVSDDANAVKVDMQVPSTAVEEYKYLLRNICT